MIHSIQNEEFQVSVQHKGAELCSIKSLRSGREFMWDAKPDVWGSFAPVLFPVIGSIRPQGLVHNEKSYHTPKHGLIRNNENLVCKPSHNGLVFELASDAQSLALYPFAFFFRLSFTLIQNKIEVKHEVENRSAETMFFSLGGHPAFKCPINQGEKYEDYYLAFEKQENAQTRLLKPSGMLSTQYAPCLTNTNKLPLSKSLFANDALIFNNLNSTSIELKSKTSAQLVRVSFDGFTHLGIWAKPGAEFVCIEPWYGLADTEEADGSWQNKEGGLSLAQGETFAASYFIEIEEAE